MNGELSNVLFSAGHFIYSGLASGVQRPCSTLNHDGEIFSVNSNSKKGQDCSSYYPLCEQHFRYSHGPSRGRLLLVLLYRPMATNSNYRGRHCVRECVWCTACNWILRDIVTIDRCNYWHRELDAEGKDAVHGACFYLENRAPAREAVLAPATHWLFNITEDTNKYYRRWYPTA